MNLKVTFWKGLALRLLRTYLAEHTKNGESEDKVLDNIAFASGLPKETLKRMLFEK